MGVYFPAECKLYRKPSPVSCFSVCYEKHLMENHYFCRHENHSGKKFTKVLDKYTWQ